MRDIIIFIINFIDSNFIFIILACLVYVIIRNRVELSNFRITLRLLISNISLKPATFIVAYIVYVIFSLMIISSVTVGISIGWLYSIGYIIVGVPLFIILSIFCLVKHIKKGRVFVFVPFFILIIINIILIAIFQTSAPWASDYPYINWWYGENPPRYFADYSIILMYIFAGLNIFLVIMILFNPQQFINWRKPKVGLKNIS